MTVNSDGRLVFEVDRTDLARSRMVEAPARSLESGEVRLAVERFAVTTNNITYAVAGDMLDYWGFHPAERPWGRIPAMGLVSVAETSNDTIPVGGRYFGFVPMATEFVIAAERRGTGFRDVGPHRTGHAATYTTFRDVAGDAMFRPELADEYLLLWGLFTTSFLADDALADRSFLGAEQVIVTSASSKTSICLAACLARRDGQRSVGLTSERNREFVEGLGLYDEVVTYHEVDRLDPTVPTALVDMAGSARVRSAVHTHFEDRLTVSMMIGATHRDDPAGSERLPGPRPEFFFAPTRIAERTAEWGADELNRRIAESFGALLDRVVEWMTVSHHEGITSLESVYRDLLDGASDPSVGHIVVP